MYGSRCLPYRNVRTLKCGSVSYTHLIRDADGKFVFNAVPTTDWGSPETLEYWRQTWAELLKATFNDMNTVGIRTETRTNTITTMVDGEEVEETTITLNIYINIQSLTYLEGAELYAFDEDQMEMLEELMSPQYYSFFAELINVDIYGDLTAGDLANLVNDLPTGTMGTTIA